MGSGASTDTNTRNTIRSLVSKPQDASDITDLEQAKNEIKALRKIARELQIQLKDDSRSIVNQQATKKREAVYDRGENVKRSADYVPKVISKPKDIKELLFNIVTTNILFSSYSLDEHVALVDAFESITVSADTFVIRQGESGDIFYVVQTGTLNIFVKGADGKTNRVGNPLTNGSSFGELALMYNTPRAASIQAVSDCTLWSIDRHTYRSIIVYFKYLRNKKYMEFLKNVVIMERKLGSLMNDTEIEKVTVSLERETYEKGETIVRQGNRGDHFYILAEGTVGVYKTMADGKEEKLTVLKQGDYFGEKALLQEDVRQASCIAESKVVCLSLEREDFIEMMGSFDDIITKGKITQEPSTKLMNSNGRQFQLNITLDDLDIMNTLGCGAFGRVKLCKLKSKDSYYALKCQSKKAIIDSGLQEHVLNEMRVMKMISHPFIAQLYSALQDQCNLYFVLELLQGGELFTHLRNRGKLSEASAKFYASIVVYAFSSLHSKKIAYRDLKPENLVMDSNGYVKLVDFGLAKQLLNGKTWTLCGTPDYLAPEIILNEGHDQSVDYWALGVLIYEMVVGAPPFYADEPMDVYEKIIRGNPSIPSFFTRNLSDLIKKLLRSQQAKRLGNTRGGTAAIIKHKWFSSFDWAALENGEMKVPYKPIVNSKDDVSNFERFDEGEPSPTSDWMPDLYS
eukprot:gene19176-25021_t